MQFGRAYEAFEVGAVYQHWPGKTVTEYDDHLFCLLTMNHHPLHLDANYAARATDFQKMWLTNGGTSNLVAVLCKTDDGHDVPHRNMTTFLLEEYRITG